MMKRIVKLLRSACLSRERTGRDLRKRGLLRNSRQLQLEELEDRRLLSTGAAKNVILMISDGQGFNSVRATDYWVGSPAVYESFPVKYGVQTTSATGLAGGHAYNPARMASDFNYAKSYGATDSAAAATAMYTGQKVYDEGINWSTSNQPLTTFFEDVAQHGKSIGAVSSVQISNATPVAVYGHNRSRTDYVNLAKEAVYGSNPVAANNYYDAGNYNGNLKVVMGAGHPDYDDNGVYAPSVTDNWVGGAQAWTDLGNGVNGWTRVDTTAGIQNLAAGVTPDKVFGVARVNQTLQAYRSPSGSANDKTLPYADPQTAGLPALADMTRAALNVLDNNPDGFAVMIEGGAVDWANHARRIGRMIEEQIDFNNSVQAVVDYLDAGTNGNNWDNTLLIVTADHETGYLWGDGSTGSTFFDVNNNGKFDSGVDYAHVKDNGSGQLPSVWYFGGNHSNSLVPLFAKGAGSDRFANHILGTEPNLRALYNLDASWTGQYIDNTSIFTVMNEAVPPRVSVTVSPVSVAEDGGGQLTYTFTRSRATAEPLTVTFRVAGTAAFPSDYTVSGAASFDAEAGTVTFAAGSATAVVTITPIADDVPETDETAWLLVLPGVDYAAGSPAGAVGTIANDDTDTLVVAEFVPADTGFVARFERDLDPSVLNLYDSASHALGAADVTVTGATVGPVHGSLVLSAGRRQITFVQTGGLLEPDTYTVTLFSGATRFRDTGGGTLDGNADGTPGDDYQTAFTVSARPAGTVAVSLPDFARGAGQPVSIPNTDTGLPIRIDNVAGITSLAVDLVYDEDLLEITAATVAAGLPSGWSVALDTSTTGVATVTASGTQPLSGADVDVVRLTAAVPNDAPYGASQAIRLENVSVNEGAIAAVGDVAIHKAAYLGDVDASGIHSAADAFLTVQAALGLADGFAAHAWTDPRIVGDADGSGVLSAADAFLIVQEGLGIAEPFVPDNPRIGVTPVVGGVDPQFQIGENIPADSGGLVSVPVKLDIEAAARNVGAIDFDLFFDPSQLTIDVRGGVSAGADTAGGWAVSSTLVDAGHLRVGMLNSRARPLGVGLREIARLEFHVAASLRDAIPLAERAAYGDAVPVSERPGYVVALDIEPVDPYAGGYSWTAMDGSVAIAAANVWHNAANLFDLDGLEDLLADLVNDIAAAWR